MPTFEITRQVGNPTMWQRFTRLESLRVNKGVVSYVDFITINGTKFPTFQEAATLSKSEDLINEVLGDATSMNIAE
ncbi:hypothetical protein TNCV_1983181 [Trichonephila clavipes]|nr:hypothetical protein TNCV_1983181 [Trichonephila clavipes]